MEFKVNKADAVKHEVEFELSYEDLAPHFEKAIKKYQKKAEIPGFRKGKAPVSMIKRMYGEMIEQASLEDVANEVYKNYLDENHVHPLGEAQMVDMDYENRQMFKFKIKYEVKPDFELADYKGVSVSRTVYPIDEKIIDDEVKYMQSKHVTYEPAEKADGDEFTITMDVQKLDDTGVELIGQGDKDVRFYLNDPQINKEFKEQLDQIAPGEERVLMLPGQEEGTTEKYKVYCTKVEKVLFPELNEEFYNTIYKDAGIKTSEDFRAKVKTDLEAIYKNIGEQEVRNNIVSELIKLNDVPVPDALVENILNSYVEDVKNQNPKRQLPSGFDEEEFRRTKRAEAILQVKWYLIRDKIVEQEKMEVSDADLEPVIEADAKKYNLPVDKIKAVYENNADVKYRILDDKLMNFLIENAKVKEVLKSDEKETDSTEDSKEEEKEAKPKKTRKKKS